VYDGVVGIHIGDDMRTNIDIDDALMAEAMAAGDFKTKRAAVEAGLRLLARRKRQAEVLDLFGKIDWQDPEADPVDERNR